MNELIELMATRGYMRLPLRRSVLGHLHTDGMLNGRPVEVLVDTGASAAMGTSQIPSGARSLERR